MALDQTMIVAGIGCRKGASAAEIDVVINAAFDRAGLAAAALGAIATSTAKAGEAGIIAAANARGVPLHVVAEHDLAAAADRVVTRSARVLALTGVPCVAEAAALAAAAAIATAKQSAPTTEELEADGILTAWRGMTRLVLARIAVGPATCALAETGDT